MRVKGVNNDSYSESENPVQMLTKYPDYVKKLKEVCKRKNLLIKTIGFTGKKKEHPIFCVTNTAKKSMAAVCFSAGIHGDEVAGSLAIIHFIETFDFKHARELKLIIFPVANPSGFDRGKRRNYLNKDLNGHFCRKRLSGENRIFYNAIKHESLLFFCALHEDIDETHFYLYNFENKEEPVYRKIIWLASKHFLINKGKKIYNDANSGGLIINRSDGSFEDRMFRDGVPFSMCTETPGRMSLEKRIGLNVKIMREVIAFTRLKLKENNFSALNRKI